MNTPLENDFESPSLKSSFLPLLLLGISFALILLFQVSALQAQRGQLQTILEQNKKGVEQSQQVQGALQKLVMDLMETAATDKDAQAIIAKYNIQVSGTSAASASKPTATP